MKRMLLAASCVLVLTTVGWAQDDPAQLGVRLRAAVAGYQGLIKALDLGSLPTDAPDYRLVSTNVQDLGERLEALSRLALQTEAAAQPDWPALAAAVQLFQGDLQQLRRQSLPLRVWAFAKAHGQKQPVWGPAVSRAPEPQPQAKGACDGDVDETLELAVAPGAETMVQIIALPLQGGLQRVRAGIGTLKGPAGKLPDAGVSLRPVDYARLDPPAGDPWWRHATYDGAPDVPEGLSQAFVLIISVPADAAAGDYEADLRLDPEGAKTVVLPVTVTVPAP